MIVRKRGLLCCLLMLLGVHVFAGSVSPTFQLQLELAHTPLHCHASDPDCDIIPLQGPYHIQLDVLNDKNQSIMQDGFVSTINAGVINLDVQDPSLDWGSYLMDNTGQFRVGVH